MALSRKQRIVTIFGGAIILLMLLVPPWSQPSGKSAGYGLVFDSDSRFVIEATNWPFFYPSTVKPGYPVSLDLPRLTVQCLFVGILTAGIVFLLKSK